MYVLGACYMEDAYYVCIGHVLHGGCLLRMYWARVTWRTPTTYVLGACYMEDAYYVCNGRVLHGGRLLRMYWAHATWRMPTTYVLGVCYMEDAYYVCIGACYMEDAYYVCNGRVLHGGHLLHMYWERVTWRTPTTYLCYILHNTIISYYNTFHIPPLLGNK